MSICGSLGLGNDCVATLRPGRVDGANRPGPGARSRRGTRSARSCRVPRRRGRSDCCARTIGGEHQQGPGKRPICAPCCDRSGAPAWERSPDAPASGVVPPARGALAPCPVGRERLPSNGSAGRRFPAAPLYRHGDAGASKGRTHAGAWARSIPRTISMSPEVSPSRVGATAAARVAVPADRPHGCCLRGACWRSRLPSFPVLQGW